MTGRFGYTHGAVLRRDRVYIAAVALELEDQDVPHAILFARQGDALDTWSFEQRLAGLAGVSLDGVDTVVTVGEEGYVEWTDDDGAAEDRLGDEESPSWPNRLRRLHGVRRIDGVLYAFGAGRQVHRRALDEAAWTRCDEGCRVIAGSGDASRFHDLDGDGQHDLLAVGSSGALWRRAGADWSALPSATDDTLHCVCRTADGYVAAGEHGTVLVIDGACVHAVTHAQGEQTFCGIAPAFGTVYLCSESGALFQLQGQHLSPVDVAPDPEGGGHLAYADDLLLWVTAARVRSFDGTLWRDITPE